MLLVACHSLFVPRVRTKAPPSRNLGTQAYFRARGRRLMKASRLGMSARRMVKRYRPNVRVLKEIRHFQQSADLLLPLRPFQYLVKEIASDLPVTYRFQSTAVLALQEAAEAFLVGLFQDAQGCSSHCNRKTVTPEDMQLAMRIRSVV